MRNSITSIAVGALALANSVLSSHARHQHAHLHVRSLSSTLSGERITITDPTVTVATEVPEMVVYVDQNGQRISTGPAIIVLVPTAATTTVQLTSATPTSSLAPLSSTSDAPAASSSAVNAENVAKVQAAAVVVPAASSSTKVAAAVAAAAAVSTAAAAAAVPVPATVPSSGSQHGVAYSPYNDDGSCKSTAQVAADFTVLAATYSLVRIYAVDCNQVPNAVAAAKTHSGLKLFLGIFSLTDIKGQLSQLTAAVAGDWSIVHTVSVGNELVNAGQASVAQVVDGVNSARTILRAAGFNGPVVTVDTFVAHLAHPELSIASDYTAANIHAFFDPTTAAAGAGAFVARTVTSLKTKLGKNVVVTESGWPWSGSSNGLAVPGLAQQASAVAGIKTQFPGQPGELILFSAFNDKWKQPGPFGAEQHWGIDGKDAPKV